MDYYVPTSFAKLTQGQVGTIQALYADGHMTVKQLAKRYKCSIHTVYKAVKAIPRSQVQAHQEVAAEDVS